MPDQPQEEPSKDKEWSESVHDAETLLPRSESNEHATLPTPGSVEDYSTLPPDYSTLPPVETVAFSLPFVVGDTIRYFGDYEDRKIPMQ